ncbi:COG4315 family predicted lipoprotein [Bacillus sp. FSL K6-3431]|uniref:COG4315 family predicted lipoprotein n=1 Tax=Bacillus sp. FSL K6-3431 TaxID=2921500 RepID=UPI0030F8955F
MKKWMFILTFFATVLFLAACGNAGSESVKKDQVANAGSESVKKDQVEENAASLKLLENEKVGEYLADSKGMTLYYFKKDEPGKSNCAGECLENWPPFAEKDFDVPTGMDKKDFETITREDTGTEQVTYKGYPLYYFVNDQQEGDVNGEGVKDVWYIVNNETAFQ